MQRPLSAIIKDMAFSLLRKPETVPSSEAAHAALLLAHVAWNRRVDVATPEPAYGPMLREFETSNPDLWNELRSTNPEELIGELVAHREAHHRNDRRFLVVCGMRDDKVHAEWIDRSSM